jgi:amino acid adenylation domain-containing protein
MTRAELEREQRLDTVDNVDNNVDEVDEVEGYRLSGQQRRIWALSTPDRIPTAGITLRLAGEVDLSALRAALRRVVARHEILRTRFAGVTGLTTALQVVGDDPAEHLVFRAELPAPSLVDTMSATGAPVVAIAQVPGSEQLPAPERLLVVTVSGLCADAAALLVLRDELVDGYRAEVAGSGHQHGDPLQYSQFSEWQHSLDGLAEQADAAADQLRRGRLPRPRLPLETAGGRSAGASAVRWQPRRFVERVLPDPTVDGLRDLATRSPAGLPSLLLAGWRALLLRATGSDNPAVSVLTNGRGDDQLDTGIGCYAKWVTLAAPLTGGHGFVDAARRTDEEWAQLEASADYRPADGADGQPGPGDTAFECVVLPGPEPAAGVLFSTLGLMVDADAAGIKVSCTVTADTIALELRYAAARLDAEYAGALLQQYEALLGSAVARPHAPMSALRLVTGTPIGQPDGKADADPPRVHELFERQAAETPDAVAVMSAGARFTYRELDEAADALAATLRVRGVMPEQTVAILGEHQADLVLAVLGVLKAGGAYVPIDPATPVPRIETMLAAARCRLLIEVGSGLPVLPGARDITVNLTDLVDHPSGHAASPVPTIPADCAAYVLFTSGSSGIPKGVVVSHRSVANYLRWASRAYLDRTTGGRGGDGPGSIAHTSLGFDLTVTSLLLPLVTGVGVEVDQRLRELPVLARTLASQRDLSVLKLTPSHLRVLNAYVEPSRLAGCARSLVVGGEALRYDVLAPWRAHLAGLRIFNEYGPTEATVGCTVYEVGEDDPAEGPVPIGVPMAGAEVLVLDAGGQPVPPGIVGEIFIGGPGLARGYLGDPAATATAFVPHPRPSSPGQRLYRTGDLGCRRMDGELLYLGRRDSQVKIRGHRVELDEIRAALAKHPAVEDSLALLLTEEGSDEPRLVCCVVARNSRDGVTPTATALQEFLARVLPRPMVPDAFRWVPRLPLTTNGKIDLDVLSTMESSATLPPVFDEYEAQVAQHMAGLLGVGSVDPERDFFDLGGHSMLAVQLIARLNAAFGADLTLAALFEPDPYGVCADGVVVNSVRSLARLLRRGHVVAPSPHLVRLRAGGPDTPVFCVHPAGGDVLGFRDLARVLRPGRAVYGLQPTPGDAGASTVEALAADYVEAIRTVRPEGPIVLLGWSMGGLIAFDMARQLTTAGLDVDLLFLVESYPPTTTPDGAHGAGPGPVPEEVLAPFAGTELSRTEIDQRWRTFRQHEDAAARYTLGRYDGEVQLVFAREQPSPLRARAESAWRSVLAPSAATAVLPGDHYSLLREPDVTALADLIDDALPLKEMNDADR